MIRRLFTALLVVLVVSAAYGQAGLRELPPLLRAISDEVGVLSIPEGKLLSRHIGRIEDERGIKIIVVIAETVRPEDIDDLHSAPARALASRHQRVGCGPLRSRRFGRQGPRDAHYSGYGNNWPGGPA